MPVANISPPREEIAGFCRKNRIRRLALFGSVLRDDFGPESDIDVLVEFEPRHRLGFACFAVQEELSRLLGREYARRPEPVLQGRRCPHGRADLRSGGRTCSMIACACSTFRTTRQALEFAADRSRSDLETDAMLMLMLTRLLEIIGEAARNVSGPTRALAPGIPWREIAGTRDRMAHGYFDINLDTVRDILTLDLPKLQRELEYLIPRLS